MTDTLIGRLREAPLLTQAADELERLRAHVATEAEANR